MQISDREIRNSLRLHSELEFPPPRESEVHLHPEEARIVLAHIQNLPEVRYDKVEVLRRAIRESRYQVPCEKVACKLLGRIIADRLP